MSGEAAEPGRDFSPSGNGEKAATMRNSPQVKKHETR